MGMGMKMGIWGGGGVRGTFPTSSGDDVRVSCALLPATASVNTTTKHPAICGYFNSKHGLILLRNRRSGRFAKKHNQ